MSKVSEQDPAKKSSLRRELRLTILLPVVLIVIGLLLAISIPNVASYIAHADLTFAIGEVRTIEVALTKLAEDAQTSSLTGFFHPEAFKETENSLADSGGRSSIQAATEIYTTAFYALLRHGNKAITFLSGDGKTSAIAETLDSSAVAKLRHNYYDIGNDPWDERYRIYPTPLEAIGKDMPFRVYREYPSEIAPAFSPVSDNLTRSIQTDSGKFEVGYPAKQPGLAFIWSLGRNKKNDQPHFVDAGDFFNPDDPGYRIDAKPEEVGGGDDINNWDDGHSYASFYNYNLVLTEATNSSAS